jgi:hypothetical protein
MHVCWLCEFLMARNCVVNLEIISMVYRVSVQLRYESWTEGRVRIFKGLPFVESRVF